MIKINFLGDIMLGELLENYKVGLKSTILRRKLNPFQYVKSILGNGDINIANMECVLSNESNKEKPFSEILISPEIFAKTLKENCIHIVNTANNHALDHGLNALNKSIDVLEKNNIKIIGYNRNNFFQKAPLIINMNKKNIGFLGYNSSNFSEKDIFRMKINIKKIIKESKEIYNLDYLVLSLHWGYEYTNIPSPKFIEIGKEFLECGCDILYGHHSHRLQGVIENNNKIFAPSLGNFVFDDTRKENRITSILRVNIIENQLSFKMLPFFINKNYQPQSAEKYGNYINKLNHDLQKLYFSDIEEYKKIEQKIKNKVKKEHRNNRKRLRFKMISHFWHYLPYLHMIFKSKIINNKELFSVINGINQPEEMDQ